MTYVLMILFVITYAAIVLANMEYCPHKEYFFDFHDSMMLRGMFCIIVVLVHIPSAYQNRVQDIMGSFAYIGVTFFFMTSAFGLKYGTIHKKSYLQDFWFKRLLALLIPAFLCNAISVGMAAIVNGRISIRSFFHINGWVKLLLFFYSVFWLMYYISDKFKPHQSRTVWGRYWQDVLVCLMILAYSLFDRLFSTGLTLGWATESMGFAYGIILADCVEPLKSWMDRKWWTKSALFLMAGIITGLSYIKFKLVVFLGDYCLKVLLGLVLMMLLFQLLRRIRIGNRMLSFLGGISYEIYLLHEAVFFVLAECISIGSSGVFIWCSIAITAAIVAVMKNVSGLITKGIKNGIRRNAK